MNMVVRFLHSIVPNVLILMLNHQIIQVFGSDVNGIISTASQVINFLTLFEAGFSLSTVVALYEPYANTKHDLINNIIYTTRLYFQKIGFIITVIGLGISFIIPLIIKSDLNYKIVSSIFVISALNVGMTFIFTMKYGIMFTVSNQDYKLDLIKLVFQTISLLVCLLLVTNIDSIIKLRLIFISIPFLALPVFSLMTKKNFPFLTFKSGIKDYTGIKNAKEVFAQRIAVLVTNNTDLFVISIFLSTKHSSVYTVYYFVYAGLKQILFSFILAPFSAFGQFYAEKNIEKLKSIYVTYQYFSTILISILLTCGNILIIPFVKIYTKGVIDINYINFPFAILISIAVFSELISNVIGVIVNSCGFFKDMKSIVLIASLINIIVSLFLVNKYGLLGVAFGTIIAYIYLNLGISRIVKNRILNMSFSFFRKYLLVNISVSVLLTLISTQFNIFFENYFDFIYISIFILVVVSLIFLIINSIIDKKEFLKLVRYFKVLVLKKIFN